MLDLFKQIARRSHLPYPFPSVNKPKHNNMKQIFSFLTIAILFVSCSDDKTEKTASDTMSSGKSSPMTEKNIAASHAISDAFSSGDPSRIDSVVASDFVDHTDHGDKNRDSLKASIIMVHKMFPDSKMDLLKELADDEYVFSLMRFTGTSDGQMGMPKGPYDMKALEVSKFKDGKAVEHWEYMTADEFMKMMPQAPMPKMEEKMKAK